MEQITFSHKEKNIREIMDEKAKEAFGNIYDKIKEIKNNQNDFKEVYKSFTKKFKSLSDEKKESIRQNSLLFHFLIGSTVDEKFFESYIPDNENDKDVLNLLQEIQEERKNQQKNTSEFKSINVS